MAGSQDVAHMLERIFLKFGSADGDAQFEAAVKKFSYFHNLNFSPQAIQNYVTGKTGVN